jgi:hypothetical protein
MIWFIVGMMLGASFGFIAAAIVGDGARREDRYLSEMILRVMVEKDSTLWPYRVERYIDERGTVVHNFYDAEGAIHHTDKGTI